MKEDLWNYLIATDTLDEFLGLELECPNCHSKLVEIIYGRPNSTQMKQAEEKKVYLGGCEVGKSIPKYHCYKCNRNYSKDLIEY